MNVPASDRIRNLFARILRLRGWIVGVSVVLTAAGIYGSTRIPNDSAISRLVVAGDSTAVATAEFDRIFPEGDQALLMLESEDPLSARSLQAAHRLEGDLAKQPELKTHSLLDLYWHGAAAGTVDDALAQRIRGFANGTPLFRRAGLLGDHFLGIALELRAGSPAERNRILSGIDALALPLERPGGPFTAVRRVGSP